MAQLNAEALTPKVVNKKFENVAEKRPWSVSAIPAAYNQISASAMSNRISSLCSDNAYFGFAIVYSF